MGDGGVCPAQATAMTTLNLSAAQMESSTRTIAIGENAPAEQVTQTLFANFPSSFFHFNFPAEKILRQISSNHVRLVKGITLFLLLSNLFSRQKRLQSEENSEINLQTGSLHFSIFVPTFILIFPQKN